MPLQISGTISCSLKGAMLSLSSLSFNEMVIHYRLASLSLSPSLLPPSLLPPSLLLPSLLPPPSKFMATALYSIMERSTVTGKRLSQWHNTKTTAEGSAVHAHQRLDYSEWWNCLFVGAKAPKGVSLQIFVRAEVKGLVGFTEFKGRERGYFRVVWLKNSHKYLIRKVLSRLNN